ncbi:MAG: PocR ligand-binding domain-containing protein, partial [Victivallaceae bacterium]|nr:PocR ligand-binding domain-containing protein [Victivallaceae bacterium]
MLESDHYINLNSHTNIATQEKFYDELSELLTTIEEITKLEVCIHPSENTRILPEAGIEHLPHSFFSHFGDFCRLIKANRTGCGCEGYDSRTMVKKSAEIGKPFVNICHAGLGEVVFPIYGYNNLHVATVFIGQAITDEIDKKGFPEIICRVRKLGVDEEKLQVAYHQLPRLSKERLLQIGKMADLAVKGLGTLLDFESFEYQLMLNQYPAIRRTLRLIDNSSGNISEAEIAKKLNLHQSYLSRL